MQIDLRSDTVTRPTSEMLEFMFNSKVGDDVYEEDPTVNELQDRMAEMFGMEAALFCPSGTMCNQIAIRISTRPQDEVICDQFSHIYLYEGGGIAANSMVSVRLLAGDRMRIRPEQIEANINMDNPHFTRTSLVSLENTCNKGGGSYYTMQEIQTISELCKKHQLRLHVDGARIFNALTETGDSPGDYGKYADTLSVCLSKGLGAPVGSVLMGSKDDIHQAKRVRKMMGGGMRQAGYLAAAGLYALDHHIQRLKIDHERAQRLGSYLTACEWVAELMPVETNIVAFKPNLAVAPRQEVVAHLNQRNIRVSIFGTGYIRFVTHLQITDEMIDKTLDALKAFSPGIPV